MNYSLIQEAKEANGFVEGTWIQDCTGTTLDIATKMAKATEKANSNRITVAVVERLGYSMQNYCYRAGLKRLDCR